MQVVIQAYFLWLFLQTCMARGLVSMMKLMELSFQTYQVDQDWHHIWVDSGNKEESWSALSLHEESWGEPDWDLSLSALTN